MKLNNYEAGLLAKEIQEELKKKIVLSVPPFLIEKIKQYKNKWGKLKEAEIKASKALEEHEDYWYEIKGLTNANIQASDSIPFMVTKLKDGSIPTISQIKDKITLKGLFSKEQDMQTFIDSVVKEFTKKKEVAAIK